MINYNTSEICSMRGVRGLTLGGGNLDPLGIVGNGPVRNNLDWLCSISNICRT